MLKKLVFLVPAIVIMFGIGLVSINCGGGEVKVEAKVETPPPPPPPPPKEEPKVVEKAAVDPWLDSLNQGDMAWDQRDYARAKEAYTTALTQGAPDGRVPGRIGYCQVILEKNTNDANASFESALPKTFDNDRNKADVYKWRGHLKYNSGDVQGAKADFEEALKLDANDPLANYGLGLCKFEDKDYTGSLSNLNKVISSTPNHHPALNLRGLCLMYTEDYSKALGDFAKASELSPDEPRYLLNLGQTDLFLGKFDDAKANLEKAEQKGLEDPELFAVIGDLYLTVVWSGYDKAKGTDYVNRAKEMNENEGNAVRYAKLAEIATLSEKASSDKPVGTESKETTEPKEEDTSKSDTEE